MAVIARASLVEYFRDQVEEVLAQQRVPAGANTAHYVVRLLADTLRNDAAGPASALLDDRPLGLRLAAALDEGCPAPGHALRGVADAALLLGGYFAGGAGSRAVPADYYRRLGCFAYQALGKESQTLAPVFLELAGRFGQFADVLGEIGQRAEMQTSAGVLRAIDGWQRRPDRRTERLLVQRGVVLHRGRRWRLQ